MMTHLRGLLLWMGDSVFMDAGPCIMDGVDMACMGRMSVVEEPFCKGCMGMRVAFLPGPANV